MKTIIALTGFVVGLLLNPQHYSENETKKSSKKANQEVEKTLFLNKI